MAGSDQQQGPVKPTEQRGGSTPSEAEARAKGQWSGSASDGIVPAELGGSDAPREMLPEDPELRSSALGATTGSDEPATEGGVDLSRGDAADATSERTQDRPSVCHCDQPASQHWATAAVSDGEAKELSRPFPIGLGAGGQASHSAG